MTGRLSISGRITGTSKVITINTMLPYSSGSGHVNQSGVGAVNFPIVFIVNLSSITGIVQTAIKGMFYKKRDGKWHRALPYPGIIRGTP
jgi:hypothetical protein